MASPPSPQLSNEAFREMYNRVLDLLPAPQQLSDEAIIETYNRSLDLLPPPFPDPFDDSNRALGPTPVAEADGTSRIYYGTLDRPDSHFPRPSNETMAAIRNLELHFHLRRRRQGCCMAEMTGPPSENTGLPDMVEFRCECPIWHFADPHDGSPRPALNIFVERYGTGGLGIDYEDMLNLLLGLMQKLPEAGFENVVVRVGRVPIGDTGAPVRTGEWEMKVLRCRFEDQMGEATVTDEGDVCRMEFCPRSLVETRREEARRRPGMFPLVQMAPDMYKARAQERASRMAAAERGERSA